MLPAMDDELTRKLYVTYLSYLDGPDFAYPLDQKVDPRGSLAEFLKLPALGQIFISRTKPGITRGNHYHHSKTEKFFVVEGEAVIRFRHINGTEVIEHRVSGREFKVADIPPGYTHSIENVGTGEMVCIFWASEIFNPQKPDTYFVPVLVKS
jgi:UDP-2-acetamido-2,6-beta-L-arabino-hexul-4-ose reductase